MFKLRTLTLLFVALLSVLTMSFASSANAAPASQEHTKPLVIINAPFSNSEYASGATVQVESTSSDSAGILKVELLVDDTVVATDSTPNNVPQAEYKLIQRWQAVAGTHTLTVRATNAEQVTGEAAITVNVAGASTPAGLTPVPTPATPPAAECILSSKFIKDVTVPDGTRIAPGSVFVKMWDIQNDGTCAWDSTFSVVFVGGVRMGTPTPSPIPVTAPGAIARITLNFVAPTSPGSYTSVWSISAPNANSFGQSFWVKIVVPGAPTPIPPPPTPPPPRPTRVPPPPTGCQGVPSVAVGPYGPLQFGADSYQLNEGQKTRIYWGPVNNADYAVLSNSVAGDSPIATPGQESVRPQQTTQYTLRAWCKGRGYVMASFSIRVNSKPPPQPDGSLSIYEANPRGGTAYNVGVNYTWNGVGAPAAIEITGYNNKNEPVTDKVTTAIRNPGGSIKRSIVARLGVGKMTHVDACMLINRDQQTFKCARHNMK
jgi:hypothetical protein